MPRNLLPSRFAAIPVVLLPVKGSRTQLPGLDEAIIIRANSASGFCVGCFPNFFSHRAMAGRCHTSVICLSPFKPLISS